jgi:hypothetical protein
MSPGRVKVSTEELHGAAQVLTRVGTALTQQGDDRRRRHHRGRGDRYERTEHANLAASAMEHSNPGGPKVETVP